MFKTIVFLIILSFSLALTLEAGANENIKVLILNDAYTKIPTKNEKIEKLGVDIEDYDIEESEEINKKAGKETKAESKPKYVIKGEKEKHGLSG